MLRVLCCYVDGMLRTETQDALLRYTRDEPHIAVEFERIDERDPLAYGRMIAAAWSECADSGDDLCLIEQDIEVGPSTLYDFRACSHPYCGSPFEWSTSVGVALGCTRFSDRFICGHGAAIEQALMFGGGHFRQFDVILQRRVLAELWLEQPHVHAPVIHWNEAKRLRPDASPVPLEGVPVGDIGELL